MKNDMEIIKERTDEKFVVTCPHCGATIGYYKTEIQEYWLSGSVRRWSSSPPRFCYRYIVCPSCNLEIRNLPKDNQ